MAVDGHRPLRILLVIDAGFTQAEADEIKRSTPDAEYIMATEGTLYEKVAGVDALIGCPRWAFNDRLLARAGENLRWVHGSGAGIEDFLIPRFVDSEIIFTNGRIIQGLAVADHAMALLLALARNLHLVISGNMGEPMPRPVELRGKTALIVGLGGIGLLIAERAEAFGMKILGVHPEMIPLLRMLDQVYPPDRLHEALPHADAVIVSVPLTELTRGMFGKEQFRMMKRSAYFINVSRGKTVDTEALVEALREGWFSGVGLDVTDPDPLPDNHPLRKFRNVVITPHIAGQSDHNRQRRLKLIMGNIDRFIKGLPLLNVVNKQLGY